LTIVDPADSHADYDVVIAGGGMVGISLALALAHRAPDCRVLLVESYPLPVAEDASVYTPSFDARSTALSYASALIYSELGLWDRIAERAQQIASIHVSNQGRFGSTLLKAVDYDWPALGYVTENAWLGRSLASALLQSGVAVLSPASVVQVASGNRPVELCFDSGESTRAELLVVADGARSGLREQLGIGCREHSYGQAAIIANVAHRRPHSGRAFERFTQSGPVALLPLKPAGDGANRSALVWTRPPEEASRLLDADDSEFLTELQAVFGYRLGKLEHVGERHSYPLALLESEEQVRNGVVVMGNAAHSLHPVAGQGFNLALRDVARLSDELGRALDDGGSPGDLVVLERYRDAQQLDQRLTTAFSDRLPGLFMSEDPATGIFRDAGLFALDISPGLKREFVRHTAGLAYSAEYRNARP
jgi:2-octaprenyl-6-methoxyphenol hydroxylase